MTNRSWSVAQVVTVLANLSVLLGLVFVGLQLRQGGRAVEAQIQLGLSSAYQEISSRAVESTDFARVLQRAFQSPDSLDRVQNIQLMNWSAEWTSLLYATYELREAGAISVETWEQHARYFALFLDNPWYREFWQASFASPVYPQAFLDEVTRHAGGTSSDASSAR